MSETPTRRLTPTEEKKAALRESVTDIFAIVEIPEDQITVKQKEEDIEYHYYQEYESPAWLKGLLARLRQGSAIRPDQDERDVTYKLPPKFDMNKPQTLKGTTIEITIYDNEGNPQHVYNWTILSALRNFEKDFYILKILETTGSINRLAEEVQYQLYSTARTTLQIIGL